MPEKTNHDTDDSRDIATDGGLSDVEREQQIDYMDVEINLLKPATPFMRDHLRIIWTGFAIWVLTTFAPITATRLAPDLMTSQMPLIGFPLHYFLLAIVGPGAALVLSVWYARKRDQIDDKYGIEQGVVEPETTDSVPDDAAATDGGVEE
ncbi:DUF4212 domain-containing protein [Natronococcus sp. JC468]|uniref:DUF4212 domain-containing protein n=1 Tax=Natronococcus sp. JC468 TaxID=1961921 RepID=UPI001439DD53|nr:DUF4212 domain-containing protein [Natronococcus sp. JC468]NKE35903.1 DUF4212 domain-containing protein [Natronococcus sp. JC468]